MLVTEQDRQREDIRTLVEELGRSRNNLIPILQGVQRRHRQISDLAMQIIADELDIHPVEVYSVVSFYSFLDSKPKGRFVIRICRTISCDLAGKDAVANQLRTELGIEFGETTPDGRFTLDWAECIGMCDRGPAMLVNDRVYTKVTPDMVHTVLDACRKTFGVFALQGKGGL